MWRLFGFGIVVVAVAALGFSLIDIGEGDDVSASAIIDTGEADITGFTRAIEPRTWQFPLDHGAHPDFQTEWWYYTGNLQAEDGRRFGYQFTVFRRALAAQTITTESEWRTSQVYMAHFTVSDIGAGQFFHDERYARGGAGLAGALPVYDDPSTYDEVYQVWLEDWRIAASAGAETTFTLNTATDDIVLNLTMDQTKPPALQGENGLTPRGYETGNASYYYSLSRLQTNGTITIQGETFNVTGFTWMDHEFSTGALDENALGWDWFGLVFDDGRELMVGQIRMTDVDREPAFGGLLVAEDGSTTYLDADAFTITATNTWPSPHTDAVYPAGWVITIDSAVLGTNDDFEISVTPLMADQELHSGDIAYWEGAVSISGDTTGYGYAELTGYVDAMTGRF